MPLAGAGFRERTRQNVKDSDLTCIFGFGPLEGGTLATLLDCREWGKPVLVLDMEQASPKMASRDLESWLLPFSGFLDLNIAGPRASEATSAYVRVLETLTLWSKSTALL